MENRNRKMELFVFMILLTSCIQIPQREPQNYRRLIDCKKAADSDHTRHKEKVVGCVPVADAFVKSQETYKLNQDENLEAFNAVYGIYFYVKDHGARGLEEIFSRFEEVNRTQDMALNVYKKYICERDFDHAAEFVENYPKYALEPLPKITGAPQPEGHLVYRVVNGNTLNLQPLVSASGPSVLVVFDPMTPVTYDMHRFLMNQKELQKNISHFTYLFPQNGTVNAHTMDWILKNPIPQSRIVYRERSFLDMVPDWSGGPKIYFYRDREIQYSILSWNKDSPAMFAEGLKMLKFQ